MHRFRSLLAYNSVFHIPSEFVNTGKFFCDFSVFIVVSDLYSGVYAGFVIISIAGVVVNSEAAVTTRVYADFAYCVKVSLLPLPHLFWHLWI